MPFPFSIDDTVGYPDPAAGEAALDAVAAALTRTGDFAVDRAPGRLDFRRSSSRNPRTLSWTTFVRRGELRLVEHEAGVALRYRLSTAVEGWIGTAVGAVALLVALREDSWVVALVGALLVGWITVLPWYASSMSFWATLPNARRVRG